MMAALAVLLASPSRAAEKTQVAIGYLEIIQHLQGGLNREAMTLRIQQRTRQYAKRQMTWFRKEPGFRWFAPENLSAAQQSIQEFLES